LQELAIWFLSIAEETPAQYLSFDLAGWYIHLLPPIGNLLLETLMTRIFFPSFFLARKLAGHCNPSAKISIY